MSKTDELIQSMSRNKPFTTSYPYDAKDPLDSLPWYPVWLGEQAQLMDAVGKTDEKKTIASFCTGMIPNESLMEFLNSFQKITGDDLARYARDGLGKTQKDILIRACRVWLGDQLELITNALEEGRIEKALGKENRARLRGSILNLGEVVAGLQQKKGEMRDERGYVNEVKAEIIRELGLKWKPENKSYKEVMAECDKAIKEKEKTRLSWEKAVKNPVPPKSFKGDKDVYQQYAYEQYELTSARIIRLSSLRDVLERRVGSALNIRQEGLGLKKKSGTLYQSTSKELRQHIKDVTKNKKQLDEYLKETRTKSENNMEDLFAELLPLLEDIARINNEILDLEHRNADMDKYPDDPFAKITKNLNNLMLRERRSQLEQSYARKDEISLEIIAIQNRVNTLKTTYQQELIDERQFEEDAVRQLQLLKTIPRIEQAMNIYCSSYKGCFPLFLYIGNFVRGDGALVQSGTWLGKGVDLLLKIPLMGTGLTDIAKCKAWDTGSMSLSLKLGLSIGYEGGVAAKVGLAVEYNAGISTDDDRRFRTVSEFALKASAKFEIPEIFDVSLEVELAKWQGGFTFQDQYHWAAWLAARWGHFCAKARACDVYMSENNVGPDYRPDAKTMAELDRIASTILNDNEIIQQVYTEIRQYLDYPIIRTSALEFFGEGKLDFNLLKVGVGVEGNLHEAETDYYIVREEHGKAVEYKTRYKSRKCAVSVTVLDRTVTIDYENTDEHPLSQANGQVLTVSIEPILPYNVWVRLAEIFIRVFMNPGLDTTTSVGSLLKSLAKDVAKLVIQEGLNTYLSEYLLERTKSMECFFMINDGVPLLQYVRTKVELGKELSASIPVYKFIYVDLGASFQYMRTFDETLASVSTGYLQYVYDGLMDIPKQKRLETVSEKDSTLRPDAMSGEELWKKFLDAEKHSLWHLFMAIGKEKSTARREVHESSAKALAGNLISVCEEKAKKGRYKLPGEGVLAMIPGLFGPGGELLSTLAKQGLTIKNYGGFELHQDSYQAILPVFEKWIAEEYRLTKAKEESENNQRFKRVLPPPKTALEEVGEVFKPEDDQMLHYVSWAAQLQQETGKDRKSCLKCLKEVKSYEDARDLLLPPILPTQYWVDDKDVSTCTSCKKTIVAGMFSTNKHHCRICGGIFCDKCAPSRKVPAKISKSSIRVCPSCADGIRSGRVAPVVITKTVPAPKKPVTKVTQPTVVQQKPSSPVSIPSLFPKDTTAPKQGVGDGVTQSPSTVTVPKSSVKTGSLLGSKKDSAVFKPKSTKSLLVPKKDLSKSKLDKPGLTDWYRDVHMDRLLQHYLTGRPQTAFVTAISADALGGDTLVDNLRVRMEEVFVMDQSEIVVPLNLHASHWVALYVRFETDNYEAPSITYADPYGSAMEQGTREALTEIFPQRVIHESATQYQPHNDSINCGPWTVALLEYLAKHNGTLPAADFIDINTRRGQDRVIL